MAVRRYCLQSGYCWRNIGPNRHKKQKKRARQRDFIVNNADIQKSKHIICSQIKLYATIEPCIYIMILPIARGEVGGLVPRLMF